MRLAEVADDGVQCPPGTEAISSLSVDYPPVVSPSTWMGSCSELLRIRVLESNGLSSNAVSSTTTSYGTSGKLSLSVPASSTAKWGDKEPADSTVARIIGNYECKVLST